VQTALDANVNRDYPICERFTCLGTPVENLFWPHYAGRSSSCLVKAALQTSGHLASEFHYNLDVGAALLAAMF
jgi:hypothetical protein